MSTQVEKTEELRGMIQSPDEYLASRNTQNQSLEQPHEPTKFEQALAASKMMEYNLNTLRAIDNNAKLYKYNRFLDYTPDVIDYDRIPDDFGKSKYDLRAPSLSNVYDGLTDYRANSQGWGLELLASLGQFGTRAAGTVLEGVSLPVGMLVGGIKHAADYIENDPTRPEEEKHNLLYDIIFNPISQGINQAQDALIESMPIYKTQEELNNSWWTNVVRHPFTWFFADALPSIGFTVGAMVGGKIHGKAVESLLGKALGKKDILDKAAKLGIALEEVPDEQIPKLISDLKKSTATEKLGILNKYLKNERIKDSMSNWAGILNASATEATVEGYNTRKEYIDSVLPKAYDYMKSDAFQNQLKDNFLKDNEGFTDFEDYRAEKEREVIQNIVKTADNIGLTTWSANLAFLSAHNKFFWDSFFNPKFMLKNSVRDYTKLFKVTSKDGLVSDVALKNSFWINHPKLGKAAFIAKNGLAEAFEEMSQGLFSESAKEGFGSKMNDMFFDDYNMLLDPRYSQKSTGFLGAVGKGFQETYLNPERWEEGMIGFLTGMIGLPNMGVHQKGARQGKKGITGWTFGGTEEWKAYQDKYKRAEEMAKQFRTNEGDERDAYLAIKDYLTGTESKEMQNLNALGKSPMDMLRTGVVLNAIRDTASEDKSSDAPDENNFIELLTWKNKVMSGILMGYDTYVQMGISDYFDNWLNFLQNINKPQNKTKAEQFINELVNSGVLSAIVSKDNQPLIKNYNQRNKDKLLGSIAKNASDIKKLLDLYSDIEAEAYDVLVNNFKGDPNAYSKVKALLRVLTKAKFSERLIFSDSNEERLPKLNSKADFYNLKGFDKLYDVVGKKDKKEEERKAIEEVKESYKEKLGNEEIFNEQKFDEYVFDIIISDKMQEEIYKITNPTAFNEAAEKAAEKTEKTVEKRTSDSKNKEIHDAIFKPIDMVSDSEISKLLFESAGKGTEFNPEIIKSLPEDKEDLEKKYGASSNRLQRLVREAKKYLNLLTDIKNLTDNNYVIDKETGKKLTSEEQSALNEIVKMLSENGEFSNTHEKFANLFDRYYTLHILSRSSVELSAEDKAMLNVLGLLWQSRELVKFFNENTVPQNINSPYTFFTYENKSKKKQSEIKSGEELQNKINIKEKFDTIKKLVESNRNSFKYKDSFIYSRNEKQQTVSIKAIGDDERVKATATLGLDNKFKFEYKGADDKYKQDFEQFCNNLLFLYNNTQTAQSQLAEQITSAQKEQPQQSEPEPIKVYDSSNNVIQGVTIHLEYANALKSLAQNKEEEARQTVEKVFPDKNRVDAVMDFLKSLLVKTENSEDGKPFHITVGNRINATELKYNVLKFEKDAVLNNIVIDNKLFDIRITEVDINGNIATITTEDGEPKIFNGREYTVEYTNGQYNAPEVNNNKPENHDTGNSEESSSLPITQADYEDENGNRARYKSTKVTDNSIKVKNNKPFYDRIREILEENDTFNSMIRRNSDEQFENEIGETLYFDYVNPNDSSGIEGIKDLIGIWSSKDTASRKLLGIIDPIMDAHILKQIKESGKSLSDLTGTLTRIVTGNANVLLEPDGNKNSLEKLDPNNDCLYVIKGSSALYSNKSTRATKEISEDHLEELLGDKASDLQSGRIYIFTPTRVTYKTLTGKIKTRYYTKAHTSVEMVGLPQVSKDKIPASIVEKTKEFAQKYLNGEVDPGSDDLHSVSNLFFSTQKNFNVQIIEGEYGQPELVTSVKENDSDKIVYKTIDTNSVDSISNSIIDAAIEANVVLPYTPNELFIENNKRFNELKPYLFTTKAFVGESNIYFKYVLNKEQAEQSKPKEEDSNYTKPANEIELKGEDTAPTEAPKGSNDAIDEIFNRAVSGLSSIAIKQLIIDDIKSEKHGIDSSRKKLLIDLILKANSSLSQKDAIKIATTIENDLKDELLTDNDVKNAKEC